MHFCQPQKDQNLRVSCTSNDDVSVSPACLQAVSLSLSLCNVLIPLTHQLAIGAHFAQGCVDLATSKVSDMHVIVVKNVA